MRFRSFLLACCFASASVLYAQTYTPKQVEFRGADGQNRATLLALTGLKPGAPVTREQIEASLQKLADTGSFTDISYAVNDTALVIQLTAAAGNQAQPVRFANFVWWQPAELERLVEARVPLYHGELPLAGSLTEQVKAALVALLHEKGIDASVDAMQSKTSPTVTLTITRPSILIGDITLPGAPADASNVKTKLLGRFEDVDFDREESAHELHEAVTQIMQDAGYLDATAEPARFGPPRADHDRFLIDASVPVSGTTLYHVSRVTIDPVAPVSGSELKDAVGIKPGATAGVYALRVAQESMENLYRDQGYLDANSKTDTVKDAANHTVAYHLSVDPGPQYHVASVDTRLLAADLQAEFAQSWHPPANTVADKGYLAPLFRTLHELRPRQQFSYACIADKAHHTVVLRVQPRTSPVGQGQ